MFILLRQQGERSRKNRIYRLYREEGMTVRKHRARRRAVGTRAPILVEAKPNARWFLDFVHGQLAGGRGFCIGEEPGGEFVCDERCGHVGLHSMSPSDRGRGGIRPAQLSGAVRLYLVWCGPGLIVSRRRPALPEFIERGR
jgi:transposase InsO family protein